MPLAAGKGAFELLILEAYDEAAFNTDEVIALEREAVQGSLRLATGLLFEEVRSTVTVEERERLARGEARCSGLPVTIHALALLAATLVLAVFAGFARAHWAGDA